MAYSYTVFVYDIFGLSEEVTVMRPFTSISPSVNLMHHGLVAKSPDSPTVAVAVKSLQLLHRFRQWKPSVSIEAFTKVVCDYYTVCLHLSTVLQTNWAR